MTRHTRSQETELVVAVDIGTTYSAASFCFVEPNEDAVFCEVLNWGKQTMSNAKVPSVVYYDKTGLARLLGPTVENENAIELMTAAKEGWLKAEWWKLALRPDHLDLPIDYKPEELPHNVLIDQIFVDYLSYIKARVKKEIVDKYGGGEDLWNSFQPKMKVVLTTPNGWEGVSQNRIRNAAISAGLVGSSGRARVKFVSEGDAAIHYAFHCGKFRDWFTVGNNILVCDAGGGTTDVTIYRVNGLDPLRIEEIYSPRCFIAGGIFVNLAAKRYIEARLKNTRWGRPDLIATAMSNFETSAKRLFDGNPHELSSYVRLESILDDDEHGVSSGRLRISRSTMISFFKPSLDIIIDGLEDTLKQGGWILNKVIVVGGFAESDYVMSELKEWGNKHAISVRKPDGPLSKAIAHGALSWHLNSAVQGRIAKFHYGAECSILFNPNIPEMVGREIYLNQEGEAKTRLAWNEIVCKNAQIPRGRTFATWFHNGFSDDDDASLEMELYAYRFISPPMFIKTKEKQLVDGFVHLCTVRADLSRCYKAATYTVSQTGKRYKLLQYEICLDFDEIEIRAFLRWEEKGVKKIGEATIAYDL